MKLYKTKWWKKLFKQVKEKKLNSEKDIKAIIEFLNDLKYDINNLLPDFNKLLELEKERQVATSGVLHVNINSQTKLLDKILENYEYLQNDTSINSIRVKHLANNLLDEASKAGMKNLVKEKNKSWKLQF